MIRWFNQLKFHWKILLLIIAAPFLLWLLAIFGWVLLLLLGVLYHAVMLGWAFLIAIST